MSYTNEQLATRQASVSCERVRLTAGCTAALLFCTTSTAMAAPSSAEPSSIVKVIAFAQLCGVGPSPNCLTNSILDHDETLSKTSGDMHVLTQASSGVTASGELKVLAQADLHTGSLHVVASGVGIAPPVGANQAAYAFASSSAVMGDTFTVLNLDGSAYQGSAPSHLEVRIDGILQGTADSGLSFISALAIARPGYFAANAAEDWDTLFALEMARSSTGWLNGSSPWPTATLSLDTTLTTFEWKLDAWASFGFRQNTQGSTFANADLGHTITLEFTPPPGTVFSSASGLFPGSSPAAAIPEPATYAQLLTGTLALWGAGALRRRRCARAADTAAY